MKVLLISSAFNGLTQRIHRELSLAGHTVSVELSINQQLMIEAVELFQPDLIICPFLKERIPASLWKNHDCLIVHPGIVGDRGPSSLDWALTEERHEWGVTLLQAAEAMDAGDIWGSAEFPMRPAGKASHYRREVTSNAVALVKRAIKDSQSPGFKPRPLDYADPNVRGTLKPQMKQADRTIDWERDDTATVIRKINAADSCPGVLDSLLGQPVYLYSALAAHGYAGRPGDLLARGTGRICKATADGAVWIRMAKRQTGPEKLRLKLPAADVLDLIAGEHDQSLELPRDADNPYEDIHWVQRGNAVYLYFDFYNGAMYTDHCNRLRNALREVKKLPAQVIVLMGGDEFWSNGIQLNCIEAADDPAQASWENINAMDDLVREIILSPDHLTVAALRSNAGAGGAILPLACDRVVIRDGVVLNPHYKTMGLYGSEYWTYLLPRRIGRQRAQQVMDRCMPVLACEARAMGMADEMFGEDWPVFHERLDRYVNKLARTRPVRKLLKQKQKQRAEDEQHKPLDRYREQELAHMHRAFFDPHSEYHQARRCFVYKQRPQSTPLRLALHRRHLPGRDRVAEHGNVAVAAGG